MSYCPYCDGVLGSMYTSKGYKIICKKCKKVWMLEKFFPPDEKDSKLKVDGK